MKEIITEALLNAVVKKTVQDSEDTVPCKWILGVRYIGMAGYVSG